MCKKNEIKSKRFIFEIMKTYSVIIVGALIIFLFHIHYLFLSTRNVPFMDYWRVLKDFGEKIMTNNLALRDFWSPINGQRPGLMLFLLAINMRLFGYNTQIEIFGGAIIKLFISIILIYTFIKENRDKQIQNFKIQILCLSFLVAIFNLNQWEIITLEFSLSYMIRLFCFIFIFIYLSHCLLNMNNYKNHLYYISILLIPIICLISSALFAPFVGSICTVVFINFCINYKKERLLYFKNYLVLFFSIVFGASIYLYNIGSLLVLGEKIKIGTLLINFIKGTLIMFGTSLVFIENNFKLLYTLGIIIALLYLLAIFLFFKKEMYKKTYIPLFLILYNFLYISIIYYGRGLHFNHLYLAASRYTTETTLGLIGILWIFLNVILEEINFKTIVKRNYLRISSISVSLIIIGLITTIYFESKIGPYRGKLFEICKNILLKIDYTSDDELSIFQDAYGSVRIGVDILKKYNLGIFRTNKINPNPNINNDLIFYKGFYENKNKEVWINGNASIAIKNLSAKKFILYGYCPEMMPSNYITVSINNNESVSAEIIPGDSYKIEVDFENTDGLIYINIKTEKTVIPKNEGWNEDVRELGAFIISWELVE